MQTKVVVSRKMMVPADKVWNAISKIGRLDVWFPALLDCDVQGTGVGSVRTMTSAGGGRIVDHIVALDHDSRRLTYDRVQSPFPVSSYTGNVEVFTSFDGLGVLVWTVDFVSTPEDIVLIGAIGIDGRGDKHILGLVEGATENAAAAQALLDNLIERGLDPKVPRLFILDGAKAISKAVRATFGRQTLIQRCQVHKARNIAERCPKKHIATVRGTLRKAWELDDAAEAERLIRDLARRMEKEAPGVSGSILEGLDEILTVNRLRLPPELRRSLACTNAIENMQGTIRRITRM
jgi:hypothetical protein